MEGGNDGGGTRIVPESVMEAVKRTSINIEEVGIFFDDFLSLCDNDVLSQMNPLERAQSLLLLAKITTTLFTLRLRCNGVNPDEHAVKSEHERLSLYQEKVQRCIELSKAPLHPSATINAQAATRFIEHSLPDLTREQKQSMREISRRQGTTIKHSERSVHKKRKYGSPEKQPVQTAAKEFLEKAARELLGDNKGSLKGPVQLEDSDAEIDELFGDCRTDRNEPVLIDDSDDDGQHVN
ncbi:nuclear nucleic acid-binding protein C1D [Coffea eugenioides]|uniref:nuclear nucleic acid-binding protein C1D n=1 Tax=Coffea eugenioides TaxID=49369 RepID=UPI000F611D46|nr:nuclear nucleic acid-binding protein C1D [Coffea eugenioides]